MFSYEIVDDQFLEIGVHVCVKNILYEEDAWDELKFLTNIDYG